jgi:hypothetical protein
VLSGYKGGSEPITGFFCWSYLDRRHLELVFGRRLGRGCDRTLASDLGSCRRARSSLRGTIISRVTGAAAGRTLSLAARAQIGINPGPINEISNWSDTAIGKPTQETAASAITAAPTTQGQAVDRAAAERLGLSVPLAKRAQILTLLCEGSLFMRRLFELSYLPASILFSIW